MKRSACLFVLMLAFVFAAQAQPQGHTPEQARAWEQERAKAVEDATRIHALSYADAKRLRAKAEEILRLRTRAPAQSGCNWPINRC